MSKYLFCVILGIILYLFYNNINGFSIGIPGGGEGVMIPPEVDSGGEVMLAVNMIANYNLDGTCEYGSQQCTPFNINNIFNAQKFQDSCYTSCNPVDSDCLSYHRLQNLCYQKCNLPLIMNPPQDEINLETAGFEKFETFLDMNDEHFELMVRKLNSDNVQKHSIDNYNDLTFQEYLFRKYLERSNVGFNMRKIRSGIYYINNKLYFCYTSGTVDTRLSSESLLTSFRDTGELLVPNRYRRSILNHLTRSSNHFPLLHMDAQNILKYEPKDSDPLNKPDLADYIVCPNLQYMEGDEIVGKTLQEYNIAFEGWNFLISSIIPALKSLGNKSTMINIWILLYGTPNVETISFIDLIDEHNPDLYNSTSDGTLIKITEDKTDRNRLTPFFLPYIVFPNIYNVPSVDDRTDEDPQIDPRKMYTYTMSNNDACIFKSDIPHIGNGATGDGVRFSMEARFEYITMDINIQISISYSEDSAVCSVPTSKSDLWKYFMEEPNVEIINLNIPNDTDNTVNIYFQNIYKRIARLYNIIHIRNHYKQMGGMGQLWPSILAWTVINLKTVNTDRLGRFIDVELCKTFLDSTPYNDFYNNMEDDFVLNNERMDNVIITYLIEY